MEEQFESFGQMLGWLRGSYPERIAAQARPGSPVPRIKLSQAALIECLGQEGYSISSGAYSEIESSQNFPRDGAAFLRAVSRCLALSEHESRLLQRQLAYDILKTRLGEPVANEYRARFSQDD